MGNYLIKLFNNNEKEYNRCNNTELYEKHIKYNDAYKDSVIEEYWGLGIENESYIMLKKKLGIEQFKKLLLKRERYSVNYFENFKNDILMEQLNKIYKMNNLTYPIYINSHSLQKADPHWEHKTYYDKDCTPNPKFTESLFDILMRDSEFFKSEYEKSIVFDGDSIEFITQDFYKTTVDKTISELVMIKQNFIDEMSKYFIKWKIGDVQFPDHNYGLVSFLTTYKRNLGLCNNGTIHINLTLPTMINGNNIIDKNKFLYQHLIFAKMIQIVEPLLVACYGTPDVFALFDKRYSMGSLRASMSKFISINTFDTENPINGKVLLIPVSKNPDFWYNKLHENSAYHKHDNIGYDINLNKFKNHGIELRIFEWFPEEYLTGVINFLVLLAEHSLTKKSFIYDSNKLQNILCKCIRDGFMTTLSIDECNLIVSLLKLNKKITTDHTPFELLNIINDMLYTKYANSNFVNKISPDMKKPNLVNYNFIAFRSLYNDIYSKADLILRSEIKPFEYRTPLIPTDLAKLSGLFNILVEKSNNRCYTDEEYKNNNATLVEAGYWKTSKNSYVVGLKEIDTKIDSTQTHLFFAHCFKNQPDYKKTLDLLKDGKLIDFEFMLDNNKRTVLFGKQSGKIGCYLGLMAYYNQLNKITNLPLYNQTTYDIILYNINTKPNVVVIGNGAVGKSCQKVLDKFNIKYTVWGRKETKNINVNKLLKYNILFNAINLDATQDTPFLINNDLDKKRKLSVIVDISCDLGNKNNPLPIYNEYTIQEKPIVSIKNNPNLDLIAINNLPSLEPIESSNEFSNDLVKFMNVLPYYELIHNNDKNAKVLYDSYMMFKNIINKN